MASPSASDDIENLSLSAKDLFEKSFEPTTNEVTFTTVAPGRVNLIGEHTDYTGGFVLPLAIDYSTVIYGSGQLEESDSVEVDYSFVSVLKPEEVEHGKLTPENEPPSSTEGAWKWYVIGVIAQYLKDIPDATKSMTLKLAIAGNVPLGAGLSSSASLEVAVARFLECVTNKSISPKERALRCQKAENEWCQSPCGIMDQYVSSAGAKGSLLLIDCTSVEYELCQMKQPNTIALVVTNSNVKHDIAGGEYPVRVAQCKTATEALQKLYGDKISTLRSAKMEQVEGAKDFMDELIYRRAKHVVAENGRTLAAKEALEAGDWKKLGQLMNESHASMRYDYETSCEEIDILVELAQGCDGVYGARLTGGGFGGCTVTLVEAAKVEGLLAYLKAKYKEKTGKKCDCFSTSPGDGARVLN
eukprot:CAMPEP_0194055648 /NCGR_PEP_ID=MMETSP0009_2-20130614/57470_1 /TAXON_ID=210454 /ORGANISM="Grammatophora oceanica, Strain CCMP 410" /LENGTH=414 /DNA_ID=CAMNT_0038704647 /DNA_START=111 /DNA_END=1355 /DNA_ORIENTATION=-